MMASQTVPRHRLLFARASLLLAGLFFLVAGSLVPRAAAAEPEPIRIAVQVRVVKGKVFPGKLDFKWDATATTIRGETGGSSTITIHLEDRNGQAVTDQAVFFSATLGSLEPAVSATDAKGRATVTLTVPKVGVATTAKVSLQVAALFYLPDQGKDPKKSRSALVDNNNALIHDDDFAKWIKDALTGGQGPIRNAILLFQQCFGGGMLDDLRTEIGNAFPWIGGAAASYFQLSWSDGTPVDTLNRQLEQLKAFTAQFENRRDAAAQQALHSLRLQRAQVDTLLRQVKSAPQPPPAGGIPHGHWTRILVPFLTQQPRLPLLTVLLNAQQQDAVGTTTQQNLEWGNYFPSPSGLDIALGDPKAQKLYAILWGGRADLMAHFRDIDEVRNALMAQWKGRPVEIVILFGNGQTSADNRKLPWPATEVKEATKAKLQEAIGSLNGRVTKNDQFFFYASNHGAPSQDPPQLAAANSRNRSIFAVAPQVLQGMLLTENTEPTITIRHRDVASSNLAVRFNGLDLGRLDPALAESTFAVPRAFLGTCAVVEIESLDPAENYEYEAAVTFVPGGLSPIFVGLAELPPAESCPDNVTRLSPLAAINPIGTSHTTTVRLVDDDGAPVVGRPVTFRVVAGPNADQTGSDVTGADGRASFTYTGEGIGIDEIRASSEDDRGITQLTNTALSAWARPSVVTALTGSASRAGTLPAPGQDGGAQVVLQARFAFDGPINLAVSTVTINRLLDEPAGAGELTRGTDGADLLPIMLAPRRGGSRTDAIYETPSGVIPKARVQVGNKGQGVFDVRLAVDRATIPEFPQLCAGDTPGTTNLALNLAIDDGINPLAVVSTVGPWRCLDPAGGDPGKPRTLRLP